MGFAAKENSIEFSGILPSAFAQSKRNGAEPAAKTASLGPRRALAPKPANVRQQSLNSPQRPSKRPLKGTGAERDYYRAKDARPSESAAAGRNAPTTIPSNAARAKKPRLAITEDSGDEATEDEGRSAGAATPLAKLAARRTASRSKALYPRPVIPKDLGTLELDFVTAPKEPSLDDYTNAFFETLKAQYPPPPAPAPAVVTLDDFPDLEIDISSGDEDNEPIAELTTPSH